MAQSHLLRVHLYCHLDTGKARRLTWLHSVNGHCLRRKVLRKDMEKTPEVLISRDVRASFSFAQVIPYQGCTLPPLTNTFPLGAQLSQKPSKAIKFCPTQQLEFFQQGKYLSLKKKKTNLRVFLHFTDHLVAVTLQE